MGEAIQGGLYSRMKYDIELTYRVTVDADSIAEAVQMVDRKEIIIDDNDRKSMMVMEVVE